MKAEVTQQQQVKHEITQMKNEVSQQEQQMKNEIIQQQEQLKDELTRQQEEIKNEVTRQQQLDAHLIQAQEETEQRQSSLKEELTLLVRKRIQSITEELRAHHIELCEQVLSHVWNNEEKATIRLSGMEENIEKQGTICQDNKEEIIENMTEKDLETKQEVLNIMTRTTQIALDGLRVRNRKNMLRLIEQQHTIHARRVQDSLEEWKSCTRRNLEDITSVHEFLVQHEVRLERTERNLAERSRVENGFANNIRFQSAERNECYHSDAHLNCTSERKCKRGKNVYCIQSNEGKI